MDRKTLISKIANEAIKLYFEGQSAKEAFEKAKQIHGWKNGSK